MIQLDSISACIFDIEGTTTPISFVHEILFPYSKKKLKQYLKTHYLEKSIQSDLIEENTSDLRKENYTESILDSFQNIDTNKLDSYLSFLISVDRKSKPLKEIQGKIWREGYESGELKSEIYSDVKIFFEKLKELDKKIYIYSSGSIEAQELIFKYSSLGNLSSYISGYFDTNIGGKKESDSYTKILNQIHLSSKEVVFFTDIKEEADAASQCNIKPYIMNRPGNKKQMPHSYDILDNFL
jgi:enolase-phosphatase E1